MICLRIRVFFFFFFKFTWLFCCIYLVLQLVLVAGCEVGFLNKSKYDTLANDLISFQAEHKKISVNYVTFEGDCITSICQSDWIWV